MKTLGMLAVFGALFLPSMIAAQKAIPIDIGADLEILHPEITGMDDFASFMSANDGLTAWWEEGGGGASLKVYALAGQKLFSVFLRSQGNRKYKVEKLQEFDLKQFATQKADAVRGAYKENGSGSRVLSIRPSVDFTRDHAVLQWVVEISRQGKARRLRVDSSGVIERLAEESVIFPAAGSLNCHSDDPDACATNEVHHPASLQDEARSLAGQTSSLDVLADRIAEGVANKFSYDSLTPGIKEFTWADDHIEKDLTGLYHGICDEYAVIAVSYLRALGVPARIIIITWNTNLLLNGVVFDKGAHAAVEYFDGTEWRHLDPTYGFARAPETYRNAGRKDVRVMIVDQPDDRRSSGMSFGLNDPAGDGKLNVYDDFIDRPALPGDQRSGYSCDPTVFSAKGRCPP
jgi:hypothetical protein